MVWLKKVIKGKTIVLMRYMSVYTLKQSLIRPTLCAIIID